MKNMEKKLIALCLFLIGSLSSTICAQDLYVYSITGKVKEVKGRMSAELNVRQTVTMKSVLNMAKGSQIVLIDPENKKQYARS